MMRQMMILGAVLLLAACNGQAPRTERAEKKDSVVTARDIALEKLEAATHEKDSLENVLQEVTRQEAELSERVMAAAATLAADAPEVQTLNQLRRQLMALKNQIGLRDGQIRLLKRDLKMED